jgi:hypothetical protein
VLGVLAKLRDLILTLEICSLATSHCANVGHFCRKAQAVGVVRDSPTNWSA